MSRRPKKSTFRTEQVIFSSACAAIDALEDSMQDKAAAAEGVARLLLAYGHGLRFHAGQKAKGKP